MAHAESDREDLMAEATALAERAEFSVRGEQSTVIAGYRPGGILSIYFGTDPCYHFDDHLRLRRAFADGELYRTQGNTLARLRRQRTGQGVELLRHDLSDAERSAFCTQAADRLRGLLESLHGDARCLQVVPTDADVQGRLIESLEQLLCAPIELAPAIRGKR